MSVNEVTKILLSRALPDAQPQSSRPAMLGGVEAVEYDWTIEPTTEQAEKAPPGYRFTTRRRYAVRDGRMYAIWVMGTLDAAQERAWARVVESFTFVQRSSPPSPP